MSHDEPRTSLRTGHYAIGLRDGGSEWHFGTNIHRNCPTCRPEITAPERARAALLAELRERVGKLPQFRLVILGSADMVERAAVLALLSESQDPEE